MDLPWSYCGLPDAHPDDPWLTMVASLTGATEELLMVWFRSLIVEHAVYNVGRDRGDAVSPLVSVHACPTLYGILEIVFVSYGHCEGEKECIEGGSRFKIKQYTSG